MGFQCLSTRTQWLFLVKRPALHLDLLQSTEILRKIYEHFLTYNNINESVNNFTKNWKFPKTGVYHGIPEKIPCMIIANFPHCDGVFKEVTRYTFEPPTRFASKIPKNLMESREKLSVGDTILLNLPTWATAVHLKQFVWLDSLFQKTKILHNIWLNGKAAFFNVKMIT